MTKSKYFFQLIATGCYLGYSPLMPGTIATIAATLCMWFIHGSVATWSVVTIVLFFLGKYVSDRFIPFCQNDDPACIVIDEVVGTFIALLALPRVKEVYLLAFILFRFYDITKMFPVGFVERRIRGGWGIMLDDVCAGIITRGILMVACGL